MCMYDLQDVETPLDVYVNTPEPDYGYELMDTYPTEGATVYVLNMTSLRWFDGQYSIYYQYIFIEYILS